MIAKGLAQNGAKVYFGGRRIDVLAKVSNEFKGHGNLLPWVFTSFDEFCFQILMDRARVAIYVTDKESIDRAAKHVESNDGRFDILVNK
jgi:NADP-dependent 3-hydroxy acid dehydrogenase YdfG